MKILQRIDAIMAIVLLVAFFLPWGNVFFVTGSGYNLAVQLGGEANFLWLIPISVITILVLAMNDKKANFACFVASLLPFIVILRVYNEFGSDLFQVLGFGAYLSLIVSVFLFLFAIGYIKQSSTANTGANIRVDSRKSE